MEDNSEPVRVFVRIRPELESDYVNNSPLKSSGTWSTARALAAGTNPHGNCVNVVDDKTVRLITPDGVYGRKAVSAMDDKHFTFDKIFRDTSTQEEIYELVSQNVRATVHGYNTTIFAYGTTGSGKSYTMTGNKAAPGIIPRAIGDIFSQIETLASEEKDCYFLVRLSYVELYNNNFRNLLEHFSREQNAVKSENNKTNVSNFFSELEDSEMSMFDTTFGPSFASARNTFAIKQHPGFAMRTDKIEVREHQQAGVYLSGQNLRITVTSAEEAFQLISKGNKVRAVGATNCNEASSRSHAILTFHVESRLMSTPSTPSGSSKAELRLGKIHLVDLAGSERLSLSEAEGERLDETKSINASLSALGGVLAALSKNATMFSKGMTASRRASPGKPPAMDPVPYRSSKLTHLLKDSLGGNSKTVMITNVRTGGEYYSQTQVSLEWSARAKKIRNKSLVNRNVIGDTGIQLVNSEIERLTLRIDERTVEFERLKQLQMQDARENKGLKSRLHELQMTNEKERKQLETQVSQIIHNQQGHIQSQRHKINALQAALQDELTISQNLIVEQEKEIKWLKQALDETAQKSQDEDQVKRMQQVIDAWQSQARTTHLELSTVLQQAEELRSLNTTMQHKITELEEQNHQITEEVDERIKETVELGNALTQLRAEKHDLEKHVGENKSELKATLKAALDRETDQLHRITHLEEENRALHKQQEDERLKAHQHAAHLAKRVADMEKDKTDLTNKLTTAIGILEKKTTQVVDDANKKLVQKESQLRDSEIQQQMKDDALGHLNSQLKELRDMSELKLNSKDKNISELEAALNRELQLSSQQSSQILSMESIVDGFREKINKLKNKVKELETHIASTAEHHTHEHTEWVKELNAVKASKETEKAALMAEFERILTVTKAEFKDELESALNDWTGMREQIEQSHHAELTKLNNEFKAKEQTYQKRMSDTEQKIPELIDVQINDVVRKLGSKHEAEMKNSALESTIKLEEALKSQRKELEKAMADKLGKTAQEALREKEKIIADLTALNLKQLDASLSEREEAVSRLKREQETQLKNAKKEFDASLAEYKRKHEHHVSSIHSDKDQVLTDMQLAHEEQITQLKSEFEESLVELQSNHEAEKKLLLQKLQEEEILNLEQLRANVEEEKRQLVKELTEQHDMTVKALRIEFENDLMKNTEEVLTTAESEKKATIASLEGKTRSALDATKSQYEGQIKQLKDALEKQRQEFEMTHEDKVDMLTNSHREFQMQTDKKLMQFKVAADERLNDTVAELTQQHETELQTQMDSWAKREKDLTKQYTDTIKALEDKYALEIAAALKKERKLLLEEHAADMEKLKAESKSALQRALAAAEAKHHDAMHESLYSERGQLVENHQRRVQSIQEEARIALQDSLEAQKLELESRFNTDLQIQRNKMSSEQLQSESEMRTAHTVEIDALLSRHRKEVQELRHELESGHQSTQDEKDKAISSLREQLVLLNITSREELANALDRQQKELLERQRSELERFRADKHEMETRHQDELSTALASHLSEIAKQRKQMDASHNKLVDSLHEELTATKERCHQALSLVAAKEGDASKIIIEQKFKFDDQMKALLAERDELHKQDEQTLEQSYAFEMQKMRASFDKLKQRHESDLQTREAEHREDINRQVSALREKFLKENADTKNFYEEMLMTQMNELNGKYKADVDKLTDSLRSLEAKSTAAMNEAESRIAELSDELSKQTTVVESEKTRIQEECKQKISRMESRYLNEAHVLETTQAELETKLKAKYKQQLQAVKEENDAELARQNAETKAILIKRDEYYQKEISVLKSTLQKRETDFQGDGHAMETQLSEVKRKNSSLLERIKEVQSQYEEEKEVYVAQHEESLRVALAANKADMQKAVAEVNEASQRQIRALESEIDNLKQEHANKLQSVIEDATKARKDMQLVCERQVAEIHDVLATERLRASQVKQAHLLELVALQNSFDLEKKELTDAKDEAVRNTMQFSDAEMARIASDLKDRHVAELQRRDAAIEDEKKNSALQSSSLEKQHKLRMKELEDYYHVEVEGLQFELDKEKATIARLKDMHANLMLDQEQQFEMEKSALIQAHEDLLRSDANRKETEIRHLKEMHKTEMDDIQRRFDVEAQFLRERLHSMEKDAQNKVNSSELVAREQLSHLNMLLNNEKANLTQLKEEHRLQLLELEAVNKSQIHAVEQSTAQSIQEMHQQIRDLRAAHNEDLQQKLNAQLEQLRVQNSQSQSSLQIELQQTKVTNDRVVRDLEHSLSEARNSLRDLQDSLDLKISQHADEMTYLREKSKRDLDAEKTKLSEQFNHIIASNSDKAKHEISMHVDELKMIHHRELELCKTQSKADIAQLYDERENEVQSLLRRIEEHENNHKDLRRQIVKLEALRDSLQQALDNSKTERNTMLDSMNALEIEVIDHGKAKFESRLAIERDRVERSYKDAFEEVKQEVSARVEENRSLLAKVHHSEAEVTSLRAVAKFAEDERDRVENMFKGILSEREDAHEAELKRALEKQHDELQSGYLQLIQQQVDSLMKLIQSQSTQHASAHQVYDLNNRFMSLVQDLPGLWREKHGNFSFSDRAHSPERSTPMKTATPMYLLSNASKDDHSFEHKQSFVPPKHIIHNSKHSVPWSSPSLRSSPTDQLIAAILEGDVKGVRAVVHSKGDDLNAEYWKDTAKSQLPLHRAVSGLHFHGSEKLLVSTIETLVQLNADVNAHDHAGNTVIHKAIQVCTSKSVTAAVQTLLNRGANASVRNKDGDAPLHSECKRVRSASVDVIEALISAGADPNCKNQHNSSITPLTLVLLRAASSTVTGASLIGHEEESVFGMSGTLKMLGRGLEQSEVDGGMGDHDSYTTASGVMRSSRNGGGHKGVNETSPADLEKSKLAGRRVWIRATDMLIKSGAHWDASWRSPRGCSQLHLFLTAFPPSREDSAMYSSLLKSALEHGLSPTVEDEKGRSALFMLCEQMATVSTDLYTDSPRLLQMVLQSCGSAGIGGSDRTGRTMFDIEDKVPHSCFSVCRQLLVDASQRQKSLPPPRSATRFSQDEWVLEKPQNGNSLLHMSYRSTATNSAADNKKRPSHMTFSTDHGSSDSQVQKKLSSYLDSDDDEDNSSINSNSHSQYVRSLTNNAHHQSNGHTIHSSSKTNGIGFAGAYSSSSASHQPLHHSVYSQRPDGNR